MGRAVMLPESLYNWLEAEAKRRQVASVDNLIEELLEQIKEEEKHERDAAIQRIFDLHNKMAAKYGLVQDSVELIREDRER
jgi:2-oxo-4-hydroxy-4-carboxy--5-ureidoimidazoline (OHCU) decarboxylase